MGAIEQFKRQHDRERQGTMTALQPITGARWAAQSESYADLVAEHLSPKSRWLDTGCGGRILEEDLDQLEDWLVQQCSMVVGMDICLTSHRNIQQLVSGSLYAMPFADCCFDLVTCNMVMEHLDEPQKAVAEITRVLAPGGAVVINTPNLWNYGVMANAVASKLLPEDWRLRLVRSSDTREPEEIFPVRYRANTIRRLINLLSGGGLKVHKALKLHQQGPFFFRTARLEKALVWLTPNSRLLVCAHKQGSRT
jgi:SAM-dependent methyltransferase